MTNLTSRQKDSAKENQQSKTRTPQSGKVAGKEANAGANKTKNAGAGKETKKQKNLSGKVILAGAVIFASLIGYSKAAKEQSLKTQTPKTEKITTPDPNKTEELLKSTEFSPDHPQITIAGGNPFGLRFSIAGQICNFVKKTSTKDCVVIPSLNSGTTITELQSGRVDLALVQSDWLLHAKDGTSRFRNAGADNTLRKIAVFGSEKVAIVVAKNSNIKNIKDLKNKKFDIGLPNTYRYIIAKAILNAAGLKERNIQKENLSEELALDGICKGSLNASVFISTHPSQNVDQLTAQCGARLISLTDKQADEITSLLKGFKKTSMAANTYWEQNKPVYSVGVYSVLIATKDSSDYLIKIVYDAISKNLDTLSKMHPSLSRINQNNLGKFESILTHKGTTLKKALK